MRRRARLSLAVASRGRSSPQLQCAGLPLLWLLWLQSIGSGAHALVASRHTGIFMDRGSSCVPCTGRWLLNHWTTREVLAEIS